MKKNCSTGDTSLSSIGVYMGGNILGGGAR